MWILVSFNTEAIPFHLFYQPSTFCLKCSWPKFVAHFTFVCVVLQFLWIVQAIIQAFFPSKIDVSFSIAISYIFGQ